MMRVDEKRSHYEKRLKLLTKVVGDLSFQIAVYLNQLGNDKATNMRVWKMIFAILEDSAVITNKMLLPETLKRVNEGLPEEVSMTLEELEELISGF